MECKLRFTCLIILFIGLDKVDISENAKDLVKNLMHLDPMTRPTAEEALSHAWIAHDHPQ